MDVRSSNMKYVNQLYDSDSDNELDIRAKFNIKIEQKKNVPNVLKQVPKKVAQPGIYSDEEINFLQRLLDMGFPVEVSTKAIDEFKVSNGGRGDLNDGTRLQKAISFCVHQENVTKVDLNVQKQMIGETAQKNKIAVQKMSNDKPIATISNSNPPSKNIKLERNRLEPELIESKNQLYHLETKVGSPLEGKKAMQEKLPPQLVTSVNANGSKNVNRVADPYIQYQHQNQNQNGQESQPLAPFIHLPHTMLPVHNIRNDQRTEKHLNEPGHHFLPPPMNVVPVPHPIPFLNAKDSPQDQTIRHALQAIKYKSLGTASDSDKFRLDESEDNSVYCDSFDQTSSDNNQPVDSSMDSPYVVNHVKCIQSENAKIPLEQCNLPANRESEQVIPPTNEEEYYNYDSSSWSSVSQLDINAKQKLVTEINSLSELFFSKSNIDMNGVGKGESAGNKKPFEAASMRFDEYLNPIEGQDSLQQYEESKTYESDSQSAIATSSFVSGTSSIHPSPLITSVQSLSELFESQSEKIREKYPTDRPAKPSVHDVNAEYVVYTNASTPSTTTTLTITPQNNDLPRKKSQVMFTFASTDETHPGDRPDGIPEKMRIVKATETCATSTTELESDDQIEWNTLDLCSILSHQSVHTLNDCTMSLNPHHLDSAFHSQVSDSEYEGYLRKLQQISIVDQQFGKNSSAKNNAAFVSILKQLYPASSTIVRRKLSPYFVFQNQSKQWRGIIGLPNTMPQEMMKTNATPSFVDQFVATKLFTTREHCVAICEAYAPPVWDNPPSNVQKNDLNNAQHCRNCGHLNSKSCLHPTRWPRSMLPVTYCHGDDDQDCTVCVHCHRLMELFVESLKSGNINHTMALYSIGSINLHCPLTVYQIPVFPVHCAAFGGNLMIVKWLIEEKLCLVSRSAILDWSMSFRKQPSVLSIVTWKKHVPLLQFLIQSDHCKIEDVTEVHLLQQLVLHQLSSPLNNNLVDAKQSLSGSTAMSSSLDSNMKTDSLSNSIAPMKASSVEISKREQLMLVQNKLKMKDQMFAQTIPPVPASESIHAGPVYPSDDRNSVKVRSETTGTHRVNVIHDTIYNPPSIATKAAPTLGQRIELKEYQNDLVQKYIKYHQTKEASPSRIPVRKNDVVPVRKNEVFDVQRVMPSKLSSERSSRVQQLINRFDTKVPSMSGKQ